MPQKENFPRLYHAYDYEAQAELITKRAKSGNFGFQEWVVSAKGKIHEGNADWYVINRAILFGDNVDKEVYRQIDINDKVGVFLAKRHGPLLNFHHPEPRYAIAIMFSRKYGVLYESPGLRPPTTIEMPKTSDLLIDRQ